MWHLEQNDGTLVFSGPEGERLRIRFVSESIAHLTCTQGRPFANKPSLIVTAEFPAAAYNIEETPAAWEIRTSSLVISLDKKTGSLTYRDKYGKLLVSEPERGGRWLTTKPVYRNVYPRNEVAAFEQTIAESIDGARADAAPATQVLNREAFEARLDFVFSEDEALFGLGSHEEGYGNLRGRSRQLYQQNMKVVVPVLVSTRGYAILLDCTSLMTFHDDALGSYWWAETVDELDWYVVQGGSFEEVSAGLHTLTGRTPLPPRWLFGYVQSKERYVNARELVDVVREYRRREVPLDLIVLDWKSWPNGAGWGQKSFDPVRFPNPRALTEELHALGARLMVSIWPIMTGGCADQRELLAAGGMLGNQSTYDAFQPAARELYWRQAERGLFAQGIDAWWCDCTEPFEADWSGAVKPEPHARLRLNTEQSKRYIDPGLLNAYSLVHSQGIYEGQRAATDDKRVVNLTRSSYAGQHRYGTVTWNGDICATWETFRRCIPEGLNFTATGEPYWTTDVGGFFVANNPKLWFSRGDYDAGTRGLTPPDALEPDPADTGCTDLGFHELYVRWLQYAAFLPVFRSHGTDAAREIWRFGEPGNRFYDAIAETIRLRYRIVPYLYSLAAQVTFQARPMLRAVALEFPEDPSTHNLLDQFLLGPSLLVCPVTQPMLFERDSKRLQGVAQTRGVYLPRGADWYDFWTGECFAGGTHYVAAAPLERIPLFVRAGSILPLTEPMQNTGERSDAPYDLHVYTGADAQFALYEDAGDGYAYERGEYAWISIRWDESAGKLTVGAREGSFPELVGSRELKIHITSPQGQTLHTLRYDGAELTLQPGKELPPV